MKDDDRKDEKKEDEEQSGDADEGAGTTSTGTLDEFARLFPEETIRVARELEQAGDEGAADELDPGAAFAELSERGKAGSIADATRVLNDPNAKAEDIGAAAGSLLSVERQRQLLGTDAGSMSDDIGKPLGQLGKKYVDKLIENANGVLKDAKATPEELERAVTSLRSLERQRQLLGDDSFIPGDDRVGRVMDQLSGKYRDTMVSNITKTLNDPNASMEQLRNAATSLLGLERQDQLTGTTSLSPGDKQVGSLLHQLGMKAQGKGKGSSSDASAEDRSSGPSNEDTREPSFVPAGTSTAPETDKPPAPGAGPATGSGTGGPTDQAGGDDPGERPPDNVDAGVEPGGDEEGSDRPPDNVDGGSSSGKASSGRKAGSMTSDFENMEVTSETPVIGYIWRDGKAYDPKTNQEVPNANPPKDEEKKGRTNPDDPGVGVDLGSVKPPGGIAPRDPPDPEGGGGDGGTGKGGGGILNPEVIGGGEYDPAQDPALTGGGGGGGKIGPSGGVAPYDPVNPKVGGEGTGGGGALDPEIVAGTGPKSRPGDDSGGGAAKGEGDFDVPASGAEGGTAPMVPDEAGQMEEGPASPEGGPGDLDGAP